MEQLLKILEDNARLPIEDIATMLNKSPAEVAAMIDLARAQGIIKGYKTLVDWDKGAAYQPRSGPLQVVHPAGSQRKHPSQQPCSGIFECVSGRSGE